LQQIILLHFQWQVFI